MDFFFGKFKFFKMFMFCKLLIIIISLCYDWIGRFMIYLFIIYKKVISFSVLYLDDNKIRGYIECIVRY